MTIVIFNNLSTLIYCCYSCKVDRLIKTLSLLYSGYLSPLFFIRFKKSFFIPLYFRLSLQLNIYLVKQESLLLREQVNRYR